MILTSRRYVLKTLMLLVAMFYTPILRAADTDTSSTKCGDIEATDRWMTEWFKNQRAVSGPLNLTRFADPVYIVTKPIKWTPNPPQKQTYQAVNVPAGFVTDLASIPRIFWSMLRPDGNYCYAAIIHDYLYWEQPVSRNTADEIFRFAMEDFKVNRATIETIQRAVQRGGGSAWEANAKLKKKGEKRLLKRFPEDPTTRWADWKNREDVF